MDLTNFKNILWDYTRQINENISIAFHPLCEEYGLTMLQVRILVEVYKHELTTIGSLATSTNIAGANISTMCKKLENKGFLERIRDQEDERVVKVILTKQGKEIAERVNEGLDKRITNYLSNEPGGTLDNIILGLEKLNDILLNMGNVEQKKNEVDRRIVNENREK